jgi:hypothetical protein
MCGIFRRQEGALVMVEPPRHLRGGRVLEIEDSVLVTIELFFVEQRASAMYQTGVTELHIRRDAFPEKARERCRRTCAVEAFVVVKDPNFQPEPLRLKIAVSLRRFRRKDKSSLE